MFAKKEICSKGHLLSETRRYDKRNHSFCFICKKNYKPPKSAKYYNWKWKLNKRYGITEAGYSDLLKQQDYRCPICKGDHWNGKGQCIDHDHVTGKMRGILCQNCNSGIGFLRDDVDIVKSALEYLTKYTVPPPE